MKTVNLEIILESEYGNCPAFDLTDTQKEFVIYAMREACNQMVDLCAENAKAKMDFIYPAVNTDSILATKSQII